MPKDKMPQYVVTDAGFGKWEASTLVGTEAYGAVFFAPTSEEAEASARAYATLLNAAYGQPPAGGGG